MKASKHGSKKMIILLLSSFISQMLFDVIILPEMEAGSSVHHISESNDF